MRLLELSRWNIEHKYGYGYGRDVAARQGLLVRVGKRWFVEQREEQPKKERRHGRD